jgi:hypothetical protein
MWWIINSHDWSTSGVQWGGPGDIPVPCDYDGDGKSDIAVFRPSTGTWYIVRSLGGWQTLVLGTQGDIPVPGNYDGDDRCDIAVWRPNGPGTWTYRSSYTGTTGSSSVGMIGDIPAPGDYNNDGRTDTMVWRPSTGAFEGYLSGSGSWFTTTWGTGGPNNGGIGSDVPLPNYPGSSNMITDLVIPQQQTQWCWAATAQMAAAHFGVGMSQCQQANQRTGRTDCCTDPAAASDEARCNWPGWHNLPPSFTVTETTWGTALSFAQLQLETNANRPVPFGWAWTGGGGHSQVLVKTWSPWANAQWVTISNPIPVNIGSQADMTYSSWVSDPGHTHQKDMYNITLH